MGEITLEVDGRVLKAKENMTVLEVARDAGINIPTLCYHEALAPFGACRLCVVEIISRGRSKLLTACTYPAEEGLVVQTNSPKVLKARKMVIELLLARCPNVKVIQDLAREYGIEKPRFKKLKDDDCILCGLCTRICQERMGVSAVGFIGRGISREVDTPFGKPSDACLACGACASVCPTGAIKLEDTSPF
jgi:NADH dehydrogenase/NADH:ubiquinone oxidoreductase subunit G